MQIIITENEIKLAIRNHILSQISVKEDMQIDVDLKATRGTEGYTAVIDINPQVEKTPAVQPAPRQGTKAKTNPGAVVQSEKIEPTLAPEPAATVTIEAKAVIPEAETALEPEVETANDAASDAAADPAPAADGTEVSKAEAPRSIFAGLKKPVNNSASA